MNVLSHVFCGSIKLNNYGAVDVKYEFWAIRIAYRLHAVY